MHLTLVLQCLEHEAFKSQKGEQQQNLSNTKTECRTCTSVGATPKPIKVLTSPHYHNPDAAIELIGRVNEADIFVGDIWVTALIDTRAQFSTIT